MINIMRMGTHAEKDYFLFGARGHWFDELFVNSNLLEGTKSATSSIAFRLAQQEIGFSIDPITYAFALDPRFMMAESARTPLHLKRTFRSVARKYGIIGEDDSSIKRLREDYFDDPDRLQAFCDCVLAYQLSTVQEALVENEEFIALNIDEIAPERLFAPYFYVPPDRGWQEVNERLITASSEIGQRMGRKVWAVLCLDPQLLEDYAFIEKLGKTYSSLPCEGYVVWLTAFSEQRATQGQINGFIDLLEALKSANSVAPVIQFYGGFFSALLRPFGIEGVSHGVGYGEQRDVTPVVGGGLPPAKYYLRAIHEEISIIDLVRIAQGLTVSQFTERICTCVICTGLLRNGVNALLDAYSNTERRPYRGGFRDFPTTDVYRMARFHFMQNRHQEIQSLTDVDDAAFVNQASDLEAAYGQYSDKIYPGPTFLRTWSGVLKARLP